METDSKGQLGGLDVSRTEREKIATGTKGWRCGVCGRSNQEILVEVEEAAREKEREGEKVEEAVVPSELKMGWKDEMAQDGKAKGKGKESEGETEAELAEGFVRTSDGAGDVPVAAIQPTRDMSLTQEPQFSQQRIPDRTPLHAQPAGHQHVQPPPLLQAQISNDGVPMWIDRAIAGVVVLLAAMVLKVLLGI